MRRHVLNAALLTASLMIAAATGPASQSVFLVTG